MMCVFVCVYACMRVPLKNFLFTDACKQARVSRSSMLYNIYRYKHIRLFIIFLSDKNIFLCLLLNKTSSDCVCNFPFH